MKKILAVALATALAAATLPGAAFAKRGADDPVGHVQGGHGADDPAGHVQHGGHGARHR